MESPKNLSHRPIISVNDYDQIDGLYAGNTDARALSIGKAQWNETEISLKVWRESSDRWSRQSEELPIHRNLDLSILFVSSLLTDILNPQSILSSPNKKMSIDIPDEVQTIRDYYAENEQFLLPRLKELKRLLDEII